MPSGSAKPVTFANTCTSGERLTIAAVGDLIFHTRLLRLAFHKKRGFKQFWQPVSSELARADLTYANLEGPVAPGLASWGRPVKDPGWRVDFRVYGYRLPSLSFNFHPAVLSDLKASGVDVVSTANNHALDRGWRGAKLTIDGLERNDIAFTGTRRGEDDPRAWSTQTQANGFNIAWLACTYSTNGMPDRKKQTLHCYNQRQTVLDEIARLSADPKVDAVMFTPHWGAENVHYPSAKQRSLARDAVDAGATAVLGAHPHVLQPWEKRTTDDGREALIVYSMGNFISNQRRMPQRVGAIVRLGLVRDGNGKTHLSHAGYVPTWAAIDGKGIRATPASPRSFAGRHAVRIYPRANRVALGEFQARPQTCKAVARAPRDLPPQIVAINDPR